MLNKKYGDMSREIFIDIIPREEASGRGGTMLHDAVNAVTTRIRMFRSTDDTNIRRRKMKRKKDPSLYKESEAFKVLQLFIFNLEAAVYNSAAENSC